MSHESNVAAAAGILLLGLDVIAAHYPEIGLHVNNSEHVLRLVRSHPSARAITPSEEALDLSLFSFDGSDGKAVIQWILELAKRSQFRFLIDSWYAVWSNANAETLPALRKLGINRDLYCAIKSRLCAYDDFDSTIERNIQIWRNQSTSEWDRQQITMYCDGSHQVSPFTYLSFAMTTQNISRLHRDLAIILGDQLMLIEAWAAGVLISSTKIPAEQLPMGSFNIFL